MDIEFVRSDGARRCFELEDIRTLSSDSMKELYSLVFGPGISCERELEDWYQRETANA